VNPLIFLLKRFKFNY